MTEKLLSICIPTYNRVNFLKNSLQNYVKDPDFDKIEIVISDNCSNDGTEQMVKEFIDKYSNIKYRRLQNNIGADLNLTMVLEMGTSKYLKLINDTAYIKPRGISKMLEIISANLNTNKSLLFYRNSYFNSNTQRTIYNINDFVSEASYLVTWILNFGLWKHEFDQFENRNKAASIRFNQVDWTLRLIKNNNITIYFDDFYEITDDENKGGYLLFKTFGIDYLSMYDEFLKSGALKKKVYNKEKYRLFRYFLLFYFYRLTLFGVVNNFDISNATKYLLVNYKYDIYYYLGILYVYIHVFLKKNKLRLIS